MKIYVAGNNLKRARAVMDDLIARGHIITFDWVSDIKNNTNPLQKVQKIIAEREAVKEADALVLLWAPDQESARYEAGMAMGLHKPIVVSEFTKKEKWFTLLPEVVSVDSDKDIITALELL